MDRDVARSPRASRFVVRADVARLRAGDAVSTKAFYDHLDACKRCRERPHDLCAIGAQLLKATCDGFAGELAPMPITPAKA